MDAKIFLDHFRYRPLMIHALLLIVPYLSFADGWGFRGHIAISRLAYNLINEKTINYMSRVMGKPVGHPEFVEMSIWADRVARKDPYEWSKNLHFTQKGGCLGSFTMREDPDCLLSSVSYFTRVLLNDVDRGSKVEKQDALRFLIHFAGDLHAPFHIGDEHDLNGAHIKVFDPVMCLLDKQSPVAPSTSLHQVWDSHVLKLREAQTGESLNAIIDSFVSTINKQRQTTLRGRYIGLRESESIPELTLRQAGHSRTITKEVGLLDAKGRPIVSGDHLSREYFDTACPVALGALREAGVNLASILNRIADSQDL